MKKSTYRWDIQGLRALAVLAVVIFHISPNRLPGGYLGVDIFFVISGYLIIGFICRDVCAQKFNLSAFYGKRIKRLFPALFVTIIATIFGAYFLLLPEETIVFAKSVISTLLYVSNMFFYAQSDYFAADLKLAPLLHTWSLSVEEQFYILFPILLMAIIKLKPASLQLVLIVIAVLSFILSEYLVRTDPSLAFFISPTRFWQFIVGGLLALNLHKMALSKRLSNIIGFAGLVTLVICLFRYDEATLFPGINAIVPTVATLCVLWAGSTTGLFSGLMAHPINRFFGNISYSLYLLHWPVIVFYKLGINNEYSIMTNNIIVLLISIGLGFLSWKYIELPFSTRKKDLDKTKGRTFVTTLAVSVTVIALMTFSLSGLPGRFNEQQLYYSSFMNYESDQGYRRGTCFIRGSEEDLRYYDKNKCINFDNTKYNILLFGDSHAAQWNSALTELLTANQTLTQLTSSGCRPLLPIEGEKGCKELVAYGLNELIPHSRFDRIIIAGRWESKDFKKLARMTERLKEFTDDVTIVGRTLEYNQYLPRVLAATTEISEIENDKQNQYTQLKKLDNTFKMLANTKGIYYVSLIDILCPKGATSPCKSVTNEGVPIAFDYGHFTHEGALETLKKWDYLSESSE